MFLKFCKIQLKTPETCNSNKERLQCRCFPVNLAKFSSFQEPFFKKHPRTAASGFFHSLKGTLTDTSTWCIEKYCPCDQACQLSASLGYTLAELFRKPENWRQIYKQTSLTFHTSNDVSRRRNY